MGQTGSSHWKRGVCGCCGDPPRGRTPEDRAKRDEACCACFGACKVYILPCTNFCCMFCLLGCYSCCCFCCQISSLSGEVNVPDDDENLSCDQKRDRCCVKCFIPCGSLCGLRGWVREQYDIKGIQMKGLSGAKSRFFFCILGDCCSDCCVSFCCPCCALMQTAYEIKERNQETETETLITDQPL